jgi:hypothetical protein
VYAGRVSFIGKKDNEPSIEMKKGR